MATPHPAAPDWFLLPPAEQQLASGWVGYRHVTGVMHWHHAASDEDRLSVALVIPTPSDDDSGIAHALEHMVLRGSTRYPEPETFLALRAELTLLEFNATTQKESTRFHLSGYDPASVLRGIGFMSDCVFSPLLNSDDFDEEIVRHTVRADGLGLDGTLYRELTEYQRNERFNESVDMAVNSEPRAPLYGGMTDTLQALDIVKLRRYHNTYYRPENAVLISSGSWPMIGLWRQVSKALSHVGKALSTPDDDDKVRHERPVSSPAALPELRIETLHFSPYWASVLHPALRALRCQKKLAEMGAILLPLNSDFQPKPTLRFRVTQHTDIAALSRWLEHVQHDLSARRIAWHSQYFALEQGRLMANRWGDGLQRLFHDFAISPFASPYLKAMPNTETLPHESERLLAEPQGEWLSPCQPLRRLSILCRCQARDQATRAAIERWLALCQQRTLRWAWMKGSPILCDIRQWDCANAVIIGYTVDLPVSDVEALRQFWHHTLRMNEIEAIPGTWQRNEDGMVFLGRGSAPVYRTGSVMASHKDEDSAMHVTLSFPHTVEAGDIAVLGQAVMATSMIQKRRLGGRCYAVSVGFDLMHYELTFDTVADGDPSVSFIALLNAFEVLSKPLDDPMFEKACHGGLGLVSAKYNKSQGRFHRALLGMVGQTSAIDVSKTTPDSLVNLVTRVLAALKQPTLH
ncbi:insulinase family protein [Enterovibrio norvegicus]|uniref:insulinase family protein n=1 Tax=Enterovibrio norvegicus TaxID=188144 RepID=UPI000C84AC26|nr:insulinase family protein [Enterovibrio norvegicus]PML81593.1 peptidase insulinase [Enterovibrio norvegicus]